MNGLRNFTAVIGSLIALTLAEPAHPQQKPPSPPANAQAGAPVDLTGQWVSVVTEDWRWRMITPPKGDYTSVPLTAAGKAAANAWDLAADNAAQFQCKAYGAPAIMRVPGRIRISWQDPNTLKIVTDAGQQERLFHFIASAPGNEYPQLEDRSVPTAERSWQGYTKAQWFKQRQSRGLGFGGSTGSGGALRAVTRNLRAGYLRKNGVPYSENAVVTEHYNVFKTDNGTIWLTITTIVEDPLNLTEPFITSTEFKKESDASKWSPSACHTDPPAEPRWRRKANIKVVFSLGLP
jgi:hypothetical protein